jgi:hypothetical protein
VRRVPAAEGDEARIGDAAGGGHEVSDNLGFNEALSALRGQEPQTDAFDIWKLGNGAKLAKAIIPFRCANCVSFVVLFIIRDGGLRCTFCDHDYVELKKKGWN